MALDIGVAGGPNRVNFGSGATLDNVNTVTVLMWVFPDGSNADGLWDKSEAAYANWRQFSFDQVIANSIIIQFSRATTTALSTSATNAYTTGAWNFLGFSWDGGSTAPKIYRGALTIPVAEVSYSGTPTAGSGAIGNDSANSLIIGNLVDLVQGLDGKIATIHMFSRVLSITEMQTVQFRPSLRPANCVLYSHLGLVGTGTQPDWSGNGNTGTVTGATVSAHVPLGGLFGIPQRRSYVVAAAADTLFAQAIM